MMPHRLSARFIGLLFAVTYWTTQTRFLGFTLGGWLKALPIFLILLAFYQEWAVNWLIVGFILAAAIRLLYWVIGRTGYIRFLPSQQNQPPDQAAALADNQRISLYATGTFSVHDHESYLLERPAEYWRIPLGEHVIMVRQLSGRYLYQFLRNETMQKITPGYLLFGTRPRLALSIQFLCTWGPESARYENAYYVQSNGAASKQQRTIYFTFDDEARRNVVWYNLLQDFAQR